MSLGGERVLPLAAFRGTTRPVIIAGTRTQLSRALAGAEPFQEALRERGVSVVPVQLAGEDAGEKLRQLKAEFAGGGGSSSKGFGSSGGGGGDKAAAAAAPAAAAGLTSKVRLLLLRLASPAPAMCRWPGSGCWPKLAATTTTPRFPATQPCRCTCFCLGASPPPPLQDRKWQLKAFDESEWQQWLAEQKQAAGITAETVYVQVGLAGSLAGWLAGWPGRLPVCLAGCGRLPLLPPVPPCQPWVVAHPPLPPPLPPHHACLPAHRSSWMVPCAPAARVSRPGPSLWTICPSCPRCAPSSQTASGGDTCWGEYS